MMVAFHALALTAGEVWTAKNVPSLLRSPELLAEVEVNRNSYAVTLGSLTSQLGKLSSLVADSWSNTAPYDLR